MVDISSGGFINKWIDLSKNKLFDQTRKIPKDVLSECTNQFTIKIKIINGEAKVNLSNLPVTGTNYLKMIRYKNLSNIKAIEFNVGGQRMDYLERIHPLLFNKLKKIFQRDDPYMIPFSMLMISEYIPVPSHDINFIFQIEWIKPLFKNAFIECEFINYDEHVSFDLIFTYDISTIHEKPKCCKSEWKLHGYSQYVLIYNPNELISAKIYWGRRCICPDLKIDILGDHFYLIHFDKHSLVTTDESQFYAYLRDMDMVKLRIESEKNDNNIVIYQFRFNLLTHSGGQIGKMITYMK